MKKPDAYHHSHRLLSLSVVIVICLFITACSKSKPQVAEAPPAYQPPPPATVQMPTVLAPKLNEVQDAIQRVFKGAAVLDSSSEPGFVAGDFNGDATQDIAIVIKPAPGKLDSMNEEYPSWLLRDPFTPEDARPSSLRVTENESLLAIIHGYGANDWRDPQATQTFLLKNVVGANMEAQAGKEFIKANHGKKMPPIKGDLIGQILRGNHGYIYYSTGTYRWFDPKSFSDEPRRGAFHGAMARN